MALKPGLKSFLLWSLTVIVTLSSVIYQRLTGPTHPLRGRIQVNDTSIKYRFLRNYNTTSDAPVKIVVPDQKVKGEMQWKRYKSHDEWHLVSLERHGDTLMAWLPKQPSAGKVMYRVTLHDEMEKRYPLSTEPVILRFKDPVPAFILFPHVIIMFISMLLGVRAGLEALGKGQNAYRFTLWATVLLFIGGLILGPLVQKYAFGAYWTGWPFGHDLTDNKTLLSFIFWGIALWVGRKPGKGRIWIIIAAVVQLLIYLIPHSVLGSEIDYTKIES